MGKTENIASISLLFPRETADPSLLTPQGEQLGEVKWGTGTAQSRPVEPIVTIVSPTKAPAPSEHRSQTAYSFLPIQTH